MRDEVAWLALGAAIGSRQLLARLLAEVPGAAFDGAARQLRSALGRDRAAVLSALSLLGVQVVGDQTAADAILEATATHGARRAQQSLAGKLGRAASLMTPEQFREYLREQVGEYIGHEEANPEAARVAEANGRQAGTGPREAQTVPPTPRTAG